MFNSKLMPWRMAQIRRAFVDFITIPLAVSETYWKTWAAVYRP